MAAPIHRLKKKEILYLATHRCKHRHPYIDHYACYLKENPCERMGFLDIEASGLDAGFGFMLSWAIKVGREKTILCDVITQKDIDDSRLGDEDKRIVGSCVKAITTFDKIITHYGGDFRYDVPFIRTRACSLSIPFPEYNTIKMADTFSILKKKFRLPRNRLETAMRVLFGHTGKTHLDPAIWRRGARGDKRSLRYILEHNKTDVIELEQLYNKISKYVAPAMLSL